MRLLTDTCSAMKLLKFGEKLFKSGILKSGDLVIHPRVFNETNRWPKWKKDKYKNELETLAKIRATPGLRPNSPQQIQRLQDVIFATMESLGTSIGSADRDQLVSAIHAKIGIVTNDAPFAEVAEALDVDVFTAEQMVVEAFAAKQLTKEEVRDARTHWASNNEKRPSRGDERALDSLA